MSKKGGCSSAEMTEVKVTTTGVVGLQEIDSGNIEGYNNLGVRGRQDKDNHILSKIEIKKMEKVNDETRGKIPLLFS